MFRERINNKNIMGSPYSTTPRSHNLKSDNVSDQPFVSEWKLAFIGLLFSIIIIITKVLYNNGYIFKDALLEKKFIYFETLTENGEIVYEVAWKNAVKYSNIWLPIMCGLLTTYFTWIMVYLDSNVPGIQPPSPLSPPRYKAMSGHSFHLNYVFALLIGFLVASYLYWRNISIIY